MAAFLWAQLQEADPKPAGVVARVNRLFWEVSPPGLFASLFFAVLDPTSGALDYVNAGHDHPLLLSGGGTVALGTGGMVLGLGPDALYEPAGVRLDAGDALVAFSDGIVERSNRHGELYGVERLADAARRASGPARILLYSLLGDIQDFSDGLPAEDDATLVVLRQR